MNTLTTVILLGAGATATMDVWGLARRPLLGIPAPDYGAVGRWIGHMRHGQIRHVAIARSTPVAREAALGWIVHYLTGIFFAAVLVSIAGAAWLQHPTPSAAMAVGIGSVVAPFFIMQPLMGAGFAASRTPNPNRARLQSLLTHTAFGAGLYVTGLALSLRPAG